MFAALDFDVDYDDDDFGETGGVGVFADVGDEVQRHHLYSVGKPVDVDLLSIANTPQELN